MGLPRPIKATPAPEADHFRDLLGRLRLGDRVGKDQNRKVGLAIKPVSDPTSIAGQKVLEPR